MTTTKYAFQYPLILIGLIFVPLWFLLASKFWQSNSSIKYSTVSQFKGLTTSPQNVPLLLRALAIISCIIAIARPQIINETFVQEINGIDIMLALDLSGSMRIPDFSSKLNKKTQRIEAAKAVIENFIRQRDNDRIGLLGFAGYPYLVSPITLNHDWLLQNLKRLNAGMIQDGTAIGSAITTCVNRLIISKAKTRIIILLTDGINNLGEITPMMAAKVAKKFNIKIYAIMIGNDQIYQTDQQTLLHVAEQTGGRFYNAYDLKSLKNIYNEIDQLEKTIVKLEGAKTYGEYFMNFLYISIACLLLEFLLKKTKYRIVS